jgi:hypothetical protein
VTKETAENIDQNMEGKIEDLKDSRKRLGKPNPSSEKFTKFRKQVCEI